MFDILRESECAECRKALLAHTFLFMEDGRPLCLTCADLDHLTYLPRGDTALTSPRPETQFAFSGRSSFQQGPQAL